MKHAILTVLAALGLVIAAQTASAHWPLCHGCCNHCCNSIDGHFCDNVPWHNGYYDPAWGVPVALVVPPTAAYQSNYGWGVGGTRVSPVIPQFGRNYPGDGVGSGSFSPTPQWPSDTQQFGVYYVRGPWGTYR